MLVTRDAQNDRDLDQAHFVPNGSAESSHQGGPKSRELVETSRVQDVHQRDQVLNLASRAANTHRVISRGVQDRPSHDQFLSSK